MCGKDGTPEQEAIPKLKVSQKRALEHISKLARHRKTKALQTLEHIREMCAIPELEFSVGVGKLKALARVGLHFHPDRLLANGLTIAESLLQSGLYKSQFETQVSAGSVSARPGGLRDQWEEKLFAGAYRQADPAERPKYGALNLLQPEDGPAPRFGSCYLLLKPEISRRCTFTYMDSHLEPNEVGTLEEFDDILAALFTECFERNSALGLAPLKPIELLEHFNRLSGFSPRKASRNLDHYIEAQVHGTVNLKRDGDILVADPSFQDGRLGEQFEKLAEAYDLKLHWHGGFQITPGEVPDDYRGAVMPTFAEKVAGRSGVVNPRILGEAAKSMTERPDEWAEFGNGDRLLQLVKRLWHVILKWGSYPDPGAT